MHKYVSFMGVAMLGVGSLQASHAIATASSTSKCIPSPAANLSAPASLSALRNTSDDSTAFSVTGSYLGGVAGVNAGTLGTSGFYSDALPYPAGTVFTLPTKWGNGGRVQLGYSGGVNCVSLALSYEYFSYSTSRTVTTVPSTDPNLYPNFPTNTTGGTINFTPAYEGTSASYSLKYSQVVDLVFTGPTLASTSNNSILEPSIGVRGFFIKHTYSTTILTNPLTPTTTSYSFAEKVNGVGAIASLLLRQSLLSGTGCSSFSFGLQAKPTVGIVWGQHSLSQDGSQTVRTTALPVTILDTGGKLDLMHGLVDGEIGLYGRWSTAPVALEMSASVIGEFWPDFSYLLAMGPTAGQPSTFSVVGVLATVGFLF